MSDWIEQGQPWPGRIPKQAALPPVSTTPRRWHQLNTPMVDWTGRRVWLVGASSGIGLACAQALRAAGAQVLISARHAQLVQTWAAQDAGVQWWPLDVTRAQDVQATAEAIVASGPLDMVVYCAGHYKAQRATAIDLDQLLQHDRVNYQGALQVLSAVLPGMLAQQQGHISLISSVAGWSGLPNGLAYGPTKAAMTNLAETLYMDLQDQGIGVSVVHPGFVATPLTAQNQFEMPALITPAKAAQEMLSGWARGQFDIHFPRRFTLWLKLLTLLPYRLYFPLVRRFTGL
jgi:NAD(P)-dependent dehydrogenase (short-subunit alcohol dehydrogenase family)